MLTIKDALNKYRNGTAHRVSCYGYYAPEMDADGKTYCEVVSSGMTQNRVVRTGKLQSNTLNVKFKCRKNGYEFIHPFTVTI